MFNHYLSAWGTLSQAQYDHQNILRNWSKISDLFNKVLSLVHQNATKKTNHIITDDFILLGDELVKNIIKLRKVAQNMYSKGMNPEQLVAIHNQLTELLHAVSYAYSHILPESHYSKYWNGFDKIT